MAASGIPGIGYEKHELTWGTTQVVDKESGESPGVDTTEAAAPSI